MVNVLVLAEQSATGPTMQVPRGLVRDLIETALAADELEATIELQNRALATEKEIFGQVLEADRERDMALLEVRQLREKVLRLESSLEASAQSGERAFDAVKELREELRAEKVAHSAHHSEENLRTEKAAALVAALCRGSLNGRHCRSCQKNGSCCLCKEDGA